MGSQKASTSTTFPQFMKTEMRNINSQARGLYENPSTAEIPNLSDWTNLGLQGRAQIAGSGNTVGTSGAAEAMRILNGDYLDASNNPAFNRNMQAAMGAASQRFAGSGRVGGGSYAGALGDAATGVAAQMYNAERNRQTEALSMMPQLVAGQYSDSAAMEDAGRALDENNMARFDWPYARLDRYANTVYGSPAAQNPGQESQRGTNWQAGLFGMFNPLSKADV